MLTWIFMQTSPVLLTNKSRWICNDWQPRGTRIALPIINSLNVEIVRPLRCEIFDSVEFLPTWNAFEKKESKQKKRGETAKRKEERERERENRRLKFFVPLLESRIFRMTASLFETILFSRMRWNFIAISSRKRDCCFNIPVGKSCSTYIYKQTLRDCNFKYLLVNKFAYCQP